MDHVDGPNLLANAALLVAYGSSFMHSKWLVLAKPLSLQRLQFFENGSSVLLAKFAIKWVFFRGDHSGATRIRSSEARSFLPDFCVARWNRIFIRVHHAP
jgi:hypothetical protein